MKIKGHYLWLIGIFILVFAARIMIASQTELFSDDSSYFTLREVEQIRESGRPLIHDDLSYGGRTLIFSPFFYYLLAGVSFISHKLIALKVFVNLLASTLIFAAYLIADEITKIKKISILTAFLAGFIPIFFQDTVNSLSIYSLMLPLTFFSIYYFMKLNKDKRYYLHFIILLTFMIIASPVSIIFLLGILFFLILARLEKIDVSRANTEILIVSIFFYLWLNFLLFKKAILFHGTSIIFQNIPKIFLSEYFSQIDILQSVYLIGIIPFVLGTYSAYIFVTRQKSLQVYVIIGCASSLFFLLWFRLIPFTTGLIFLGGFLVLLLSEYFKLFFDYILRTKFSKFSTLALIVFVALIIASSAVPSIVLGIGKLKEIPNQDTLDAFVWISKNLRTNDTVLTSQKEGHALAYFGGVRTVIDDNYLLIKNIDNRVYDIQRIYTTRFSEESLDLTQKYGIRYILIDQSVKDDYGTDDIFYSSDTCFYRVYSKNGVKIYRIDCRVD